MTEAKWTVMVYMAGDNSLSTAGDEDLKEMRQVGSSTDVNVLVQFDNAGEKGTKRFHIQRGGINEKIVDFGETDSGDPFILDDFISWSYENYPADRYALILWNHGGGWEPNDLDGIARYERTKNYNIREASSRSASRLKKTFFNTTINKIFNETSNRLRAICSDDGSGHSIDTVELGKVLAYTKKTIGQPLDILGMDACLMSNFEVAYQAEPYVKYIVSSEESEPNEGWPYSAVLDLLTRNPNISTSEFCCEIVETYTKIYQEWGQSDVTQSALNLSKTKDAANSLDGLAKTLTDQMTEISFKLLEAQNKSMSFYDYTLWDISHLSKELLNLNDNLSQAAQNVINAFEPNSEKFVIAESHLGQDYDQCCGASIYLIPPPHPVSKYYADLEFAKDFTNWPTMLQKIPRGRRR
jgi:hypothetical protein